MQTINPAYDAHAHAVCQPCSAVAWPAVIAGAFIAAAVSFALLILGSSLGFAVVSPWASEQTSLTAISGGALAWLVIMQWVSAGFGGYITGRMRTRWNHTHNDEVFFRDTAHGFLTWAVATVFTIAFLASAAASVIGAGGMAAGAAVASAAASDQAGNSPVDLYVDGLFRSTQSGAPAADRDVRAETTRLIIANMGEDSTSLSEDDKDYLASVIARRTGVSAAEADRRVDVLVGQMDEAKAAADKARKVAATLAIITFLSLLVGAFIASVAAALGGRQRDYI